jgi:hypothetical protein
MSDKCTNTLNTGKQSSQSDSGIDVKVDYPRENGSEGSEQKRVD